MGRVIVIVIEVLREFFIVPKGFSFRYPTLIIAVPRIYSADLCFVGAQRSHQATTRKGSLFSRIVEI